jgi:hypothetical protein
MPVARDKATVVAILCGLLPDKIDGRVPVLVDQMWFVSRDTIKRASPRKS